MKSLLAVRIGSVNNVFLNADFTPQLDLGSTFGALLIGVIVAAVLVGVTNIQASSTFRRIATQGEHSISWLSYGSGMYLFELPSSSLSRLRRPLNFRTFDVLHLALIIHCVYYYLVNNYANIGALTKVVWSFKLQMIINAPVIYGYISWYVYRIWIVSKGRSRCSLPITVGIIVILCAGIIIARMWAIYQCHVFTDFIGIEWSTYMTLGVITFLDIVIASSLCYLLATSRTGTSSTDSLITKLMGYIINTGCLTRYSSFQPTPCLGSYLVQYMLSGSYNYIYVNSSLALLNAPYYVQPNTGTIDSSEFRMHDSVYCPELHLRVLQDEELQASTKNMFKHPDDEVAHQT
ncbi:hypothetical protein DFH29DRAFT_1083851 [Suillus ampliporus]|nr:hypothetical protein DFH29DRAFT_1083851 [Suillus ampliporus]